MKYENIDLKYDYLLKWSTQNVDFAMDLPLNGDLNTWTGGVYIGVQWKLAERWFLDWQIIGGNFGVGKLEVSVQQSLNQEQQKEIMEFAKDLQADISKIKYEVNDQGAKIWGNIPWAGLRTGLSIGYSF